MREQRINLTIAIYGCMILANTSENKYIIWTWVALAIWNYIDYIKLNK